MCRFLVSVGDDLSYTTLNNYISALNSLGKFSDSSFDLRQDYGVFLLLRGFKRLKGDVNLQKDPILPPDLRQIAKIVDFSNEIQVIMWTIILLAFRSLLRKSHFVSTGEDDQDHLLRVGDVTFTEWGCSISIKSSKTIQFKERSFDIPINFAKSPLCVVSLLKRIIANRPSSQLLFRLPGLSLVRPVPYNLALQSLKDWCKMCGIEKDVGFHSLRRGSASFMHSLDLKLVSIQKAGDWQSLCVLKYLSVDFAQKRKVEDLVSSSL